MLHPLARRWVDSGVFDMIPWVGPSCKVCGLGEMSFLLVDSGHALQAQTQWHISSIPHLHHDAP